jgi:hypothetical protein
MSPTLTSPDKLVEFRFISSPCVSGSGGSHINVTVVGGQVGVDVSQSQPAPTLVAFTLLDQTGPAILYGSPGRQTLSIVGATIRRFAGSIGPAVDAQLPLSIADSVFETTSGAIAGGVAVSSTGSTYVVMARAHARASMRAFVLLTSCHLVERDARW